MKNATPYCLHSSRRNLAHDSCMGLSCAPLYPPQITHLILGSGNHLSRLTSSTRGSHERKITGAGRSRTYGMRFSAALWVPTEVPIQTWTGQVCNQVCGTRVRMNLGRFVNSCQSRNGVSSMSVQSLSLASATWGWGSNTSARLAQNTFNRLPCAFASLFHLRGSLDVLVR